jgi:hypothetical protein
MNAMLQKLRSFYLIAVADLRYQGIGILLWRIFVKLLSPVLRLDQQILFEFDLTTSLNVRQPKVGIVISKAEPADIDEILDMQVRLPAPEEVAQLSDIDELRYAQMLLVRSDAHSEYTAAMRAGEQCYVARLDNAIVHSNWIRFHDNEPMAGRPVELKPGEAYTTDAHTLESHRGLGIHEAVLMHMLQVAQRKGCHRAYTITDLTKAGSRRGVKRVGWQRRGSILYVSLRGLRRTWLVRLGGDLEPVFEKARASMSGST